MRKNYCERLERAVKRLPRMERFLIEERYMSGDAEYINDFNVYCHRFLPPISHVKYASIRWKAFYKLALNNHRSEGAVLSKIAYHAYNTNNPFEISFAYYQNENPHTWGDWFADIKWLHWGLNLVDISHMFKSSPATRTY